MLSCRPLNADAVIDKPLYLGFIHRRSFFLKILHDISVNRLVGKSADCPRTKNVFGAEKLFRIFMYPSLYLSGKVQVDIGRFVPIKTEEGFKRYIVTVSPQLFSAYGTYSIRQIKTGTDMIGLEKSLY